jgi:hypothetical protein
MDMFIAIKRLLMRFIGQNNQLSFNSEPRPDQSGEFIQCHTTLSLSYPAMFAQCAEYKRYMTIFSKASLAELSQPQNMLDITKHLLKICPDSRFVPSMQTLSIRRRYISAVISLIKDFSFFVSFGFSSDTNTGFQAKIPLILLFLNYFTLSHVSRLNQRLLNSEVRLTHAYLMTNV